MRLNGVFLAVESDRPGQGLEPGVTLDAEGHEGVGQRSLVAKGCQRRGHIGIKIGTQALDGCKQQMDRYDPALQPAPLGSCRVAMTGPDTLQGPANCTTFLVHQNHLLDLIQGARTAGGHEDRQEAEGLPAGPAIRAGNPHSVGILPGIGSVPVQPAVATGIDRTGF